jgi:hypothetical protein
MQTNEQDRQFLSVQLDNILRKQQLTVGALIVQIRG